MKIYIYIDIFRQPHCHTKHGLKQTQFPPMLLLFMRPPSRQYKHSKVKNPTPMDRHTLALKTNKQTEKKKKKSHVWQRSTMLIVPVVSHYSELWALKKGGALNSEKGGALEEREKRGGGGQLWALKKGSSELWKKGRSSELWKKGSSELWKKGGALSSEKRGSSEDCASVSRCYLSHNSASFMETLISCGTSVNKGHT